MTLQYCDSFLQAEAISKRWEKRDPLVAEAWMRVAMFYQRGDMKLAKKEIKKADELADIAIAAGK